MRAFMKNTRRVADPKYSLTEIQDCIALLDDLVRDDAELAHIPKEQRVALMIAAGRISRPDRDEIRKRQKDRKRLKRQKIVDHERVVRASTGIRSARTAQVYTAPEQ